MVVGILVSLFAGFVVAAVIFFVGPENAGWAIGAGLVTSGLALAGIRLWAWWRSRPQTPTIVIPSQTPTDAKLGQQIYVLARSLKDWKDQFHFRAPPVEVFHGGMTQEDWERSRNREMQRQYDEHLAHWPTLYDQAAERGITDARLETLRTSPPGRPEDFDELHAGLESVAMRLFGTSPHAGYES